MANSAEEFAEIASRLASDGRSLHELHATLRERFLKSQICDEAGFADAIGRAIRGEWIAFCERKCRGEKL